MHKLFITLTLALGLASLAFSDPLLLTTDIGLTYEYKYRSSNELVEPYAIKSGIDIQRNYLDQPPFAELAWDFGRKEGLSLAFGTKVRREFNPAVSGGYFKADNFMVTGASGNPIAFDTHFVSLGVLRWRSPDLEIDLGRDKPDFGTGLAGSLYPSTRLPYLDALRARGRLGPLHIEWMVSTLHAVRSWETTSGGAGYDVDPNVLPGGGTGPDYFGFYNDPNPSTIIEALHRFTWDFGTLRLGVAGNILYARRNNYFLLTDFLPVMSWHQTQSLPNNLSMIIDATWRPIAGLSLAAELGLDDVNVNTVGIADSGAPTIPAIVFGVNYDRVTQAGPVAAALEAGYTHYLWGNFSGASDFPNDEDPLARAQYRFMTDAGAALIPLTSPYGPGALWLSAKASLGVHNTGFKFGADILVLSKNTTANLITTPYAADPGVENAPRVLFISAAIPLSYDLGPFRLYAAPSLCSRDGSIWLEASIGARYALHKETKIAE